MNTSHFYVRTSLVISAALLIAGCLSYGRYQWRAFPLENGYWVDCDLRTDTENSEQPEWKQNAEQTAVAIVRRDLLTKGIRVDQCVPKYISLNQGSLVLVSMLVGDRAFTEKWKDVSSDQIQTIATAHRFTLEGNGSNEPTRQP